MADAILAQSGIYAITNTENGKRYIGSACRLKSRWSTHRWRLEANTHHSPKLQNAWNKSGADKFSFVVLEIVQDKSMLIDREQAWIDSTKSASAAGYNISPTAGSPLGVRHTDAVKAARSLALKGRRRPPEVVERIAAGNRGKVISQDVRDRISAKLIGRIPRPEEVEKMRRIKLTPESRARQSAALLGRKLTPDAIAKRSATVRANAERRREEGVTRKYTRQK